MANESKKSGLSPLKKDSINIDKLFREKNENKPLNFKNKMLSLPSGKIKGKNNKKKKVKGKKTTRMIQHNVTFSFDELVKNLENSEGENSESLNSIDLTKSSSDSSSSDYSDSNVDIDLMKRSKSTELELDQIYQAIDNINSLCLEPIKVKIKKDYLNVKNSNSESGNKDDLRYSADINIVLSSRRDEEKNKVYTELNKENNDSTDFSLMIESVSEGSNSDPNITQANSLNKDDSSLSNSHSSSDSAISVNETNPSSNSSQINYDPYKIENISESQSIPQFYNDDFSQTRAICDKAFSDTTSHIQDKPYFGRILFYRYHNPDSKFCFPNCCTFTSPFKMGETNCVNPSQFGFDSVESLNNSLNAMSEVIIKPPVTVGRSISFRSNVCKSVLSAEKFITDSVFQINWFNQPTRRKRRSFLSC